MKYFLSNANTLYTRALLFTWESDSNPSSFSETNGEFFIDKLNSLIDNIECDNVVVNCNHVVDLDDHAFKSVAEYTKNSDKNFIFYSSDDNHSLCEYLETYFKKQGLPFESRNLLGVRFFKIKNNSSLNDDGWVDLKKEAECLEKNELKKLIGRSYVNSDDDFRLSSTPLKASGHFNANIINSSPSSFRWIVCIMSEMIHSMAFADKINSFTIVASSLRGATLAASVREVLHYIFDVGFYLFDHFGPKPDLRRLPKKYSFNAKDMCIYIGDFLIGGTEVKLTQAYCHNLGGDLSKVFVIGKYTINSQLGDGIDIESIVQLSECIPDLKYELV